MSKNSEIPSYQPVEKASAVVVRVVGKNSGKVYESIMKGGDPLTIAGRIFASFEDFKTAVEQLENDEPVTVGFELPQER